MRPKTVAPEHQAILERIGFAGIKVSKTSDLSLFLGGLHQIELMIRDLRKAVIDDQRKAKP